MDRPGADGDDRAQLAGMVWTLFEDLDALSAMRDSLFALDANDSQAAERAAFLERWGPAWAEIAVTRYALVDAILATDLDGLSAAGLGGAQLTMKLAAWRMSRAQMLAAFEDGAPAPGRPLVLPQWEQPPAGVREESRRLRLSVPPFLRRACGWVSSALGMGDVVLGSLAGLVSLAEPLKEGKEILERVAGDVADRG